MIVLLLTINSIVYNVKANYIKGLPFVVIECNGNPLYMLIDTGSQYSSISDSKYIKYSTSSVDVIGQSGESNNVRNGISFIRLHTDKGIVDVKLNMENIDLHKVSKALRFNVDGILGSDFLNKYNAVIKYK